MGWWLYGYVPLPYYLDTTVHPGTEYHYYVSGVSYFFLPGNSEPRKVESLPSDPVSASAGHVTLSLRRVKGMPHNYVRMPLSIENSFGLRGQGLNLQISYDPQVLIPATQADDSKPSVLRTGLSQNLEIQDNGATARGTLVVSGSSGEIEAGADPKATERTPQRQIPPPPPSPPHRLASPCHRRGEEHRQ